PLENWTTGALSFNGTNQYAVLKNEDIERPVTMRVVSSSGNPSQTISGTELTNPQIHTSSFLIEIYFKTVPGCTGAVLVQKINGNGYLLGLNKAGGVAFVTSAAGRTARTDSRTAVNDGHWHHVVAEADRKATTLTVFLDGKQDAIGPGFGTGASMTNDADLYVGGTPTGGYLNGAIEFLRIARGTLADSKTTIDELYAWEFDGPFLYDFVGRRRSENGGCAGAIDDQN
ncbi:MAG: LamG domain-containing protein, partial [Verrucomicrobiae bacterium]|nr:LamG domain-containing protein [Verrucomicrobiae bacterium]